MGVGMGVGMCVDACVGASADEGAGANVGMCAGNRDKELVLDETCRSRRFASITSVTSISYL